MYIGSSPNFGALDSQTITSANGSTATFTLNQYVPDSDSIIVTVGNVVQEPTEAYTASGNSITFTENVPNGDTIVIRYLGRSVDVYTGYKRVQRFKYVATNGQQTFSGADANSRTLEYTAQDIDVFYNGVRLDESEFTATNGSSVVLATGATTNAELVILAYKVVQLADVVPASSGGTFTGNVVFSGNATVNGNLTASGTTTLVDTTNTVIKDNLLGLNHGATSNSNDAGIIVERGSTGNDALLIWDESEDKWALGTTTSNASSTGNLNMTTGTLVANLEGTIQTASQTNITAVGTLTNFTSTGIDDNADATAITISSDEDVSLGAGDLTVSRAETDGTVRLNLSNTGSNGSTEYSEIKFNSTAGGTQTSVVQHRNNYGLNLGTTTNHAVYLLQNNATALTIDTSKNVKLPNDASDFTFTTNSLHIGDGADIKIGHTNNNNVILSDNGMPFSIYTDVFRCNSADNSESLFGATKNSSFFAKFDNNTVIQTTSHGALVSRHDTSCTFEMKANTTSGSGTPQFMMFRSGTRYGFMEGGVNSSANGLGNHFVLRAEVGDVYAIDSSNNSTQLSPHNFAYIPDGASETGAWCYKSDKLEKETTETDDDGNKVKEKVKSGTFISADMTKVIRQVEKLTGEKLIYKGTLDVDEDGNIKKHIDDGSTVKDNIIADLIKRIEALEKA